MGEAAAGVGEGGFGGVLEVLECLPGGQHRGLGGVDVGRCCPRQQVAERLEGGGDGGFGRVDVALGCAGVEVGEVLFDLGEAAAGVGEGGFGGVLEVFECLPGGQDGGLGGVDHGVRRSGEEVGEVLFGLGEAAAGVGEGGFGGVPEVLECLSGGEDGGLGGVDVGLGGSGEQIAERIGGARQLGAGVGVVGAVGLGNAGEELRGR